MSNAPLILSDNYYDNVVLHPSSTVANSSGDDVTGQEAFHVADNLRDMTSWTVAGTNAVRNLYVAGAAVSPSVLVLDRGHNLNGVSVRLQSWADTAGTVNGTPWIATIPSVAGGVPSDANGCLTPEGVWWKTFTQPTPSTVWNFQIAAMGAGIAPIIPGLYLGASYRFPGYLNAPGTYDGTRRNVLFENNTLTKGGVRVKSRPRVFRRMSINLDVDAQDYPAFDPHITNLIEYNHPWWICLDDSDPSLAAQVRLYQLAGDTDYTPDANPVHRELRSLELEEVIPVLRI